MEGRGWRSAVGIFLVGALVPRPAAAGEPDLQGVHLELPVVDAPFSTYAAPYRVPSMQQSLWLTTDLLQMVHFGVGQALDPYDDTFWKGFVGRMLVAVADIGLLSVPLGPGWQHEEWHRAVMIRRGIRSHDDINDFRVTDPRINVSQLKDDDLVRLKAEHPAETVRMQTAGIEGNYALATNLGKTQFFYRTRTYNGFAIGLAYMVNSFYYLACSSPEIDQAIDEDNASDGADVSKRDFTGPDCTGWVYDLHRPGEPYAARGVHPSGVGINRYVKQSQLTPAERSYLDRQALFSFLNFLDPAIAGFDSFEVSAGGKPLRFNGHVRHVPTSFGSTTGLEAMVARGPYNLFVSLHGNANRETVLPGLGVELLSYPLGALGDLPVDVSLRAGAWLQPKDQRFDTKSAQPGGGGAVRLSIWSSRALATWVEAEGKSAGWVAGNYALDPNVTGRLGLTVAPFGGR